jgi:prevent-host-death family protein
MDQSGESVKRVTAMAARKNFGKMLEEAHYKGVQFVIERAGRPMAALVPLSQAAKITQDTKKHSKRSKK